MGGWRRTNEGMVVLVAVHTTKEITYDALEWAIQNIVQTEDTLILLALLKPQLSSEKLQLQNTAPSNANNQSGFNLLVTSLLKKWGLRKDSFKEESDKEKNSENNMSMKEMRLLSEACLEMMNDLCYENNVKQVDTKVRVLRWAQINSVAIQAEELGASWVILDRNLKMESEWCSRELSCNLVLVDQAIPRILRLVNLEAIEEESQSSESSERSTSLKSSSSLGSRSDNNGVAAMSSRELIPLSKPPTLEDYINIVPQDEHQDTSSDEEQDRSPVPLPPGRQPLTNLSRFGDYQIPARISVRKEITYYNMSGIPESMTEGRSPDSDTTVRNTSNDLAKRTGHSFGNSGIGTSIGCYGAKQDLINKSRWSVDSASIFHKRETKPTNMQPSEPSKALQQISTLPRKFNRTSSIRREMALSNKQTQNPPPLCSHCQHKAPVFGKPPKKFSYEEMEKATNSFSVSNFLAEGGFGPVYKGVLEDGQVVAVKKHKKASAQGASEFCSEVEVLSCAQHRNLVMLVGYCVDKDDWLLVYEFACNGSLDKHLHGKTEVMAWHHRQKVAIGAARGLRYLHEDCRVGCIVHRDLRPNNILLTHDFEPMVGDFGIARWQTDGQSAEETRVVGTLGYMAPEYTQTGKITEKADVYSFGIMLIELITGLKAIDLIRREKMYHLDWATSLKQKIKMNEMVDPRLNGNHIKQEVVHMIHVAGICVSPDPELRPRMSQVLRILEDGLPHSGASPRQSQMQSIRNWQSETPHISAILKHQTPNPIFSTSHQRLQTPNPISRSSDIETHLSSHIPAPITSRPSASESYKRSQTPPPISRSSDIETLFSSHIPTPSISRPRDSESYKRSQTPPPISTSSDTATPSSFQQPTLPISRHSDSESYKRSQTPPPISRYNDGTNDLGPPMPMSALSPLDSKSSYSPFEESKFVRQRYNPHVNQEFNTNNFIKPEPVMQNNTAEVKMMETLNIKRSQDQDGHLTTQEYHAFLQESLYEFISKTKRT